MPTPPHAAAPPSVRDIVSWLEASTTKCLPSNGPSAGGRCLAASTVGSPARKRYLAAAAAATAALVPASDDDPSMPPCPCAAPMVSRQHSPSSSSAASAVPTLASASSVPSDDYGYGYAPEDYSLTLLEYRAYLTHPAQTRTASMADTALADWLQYDLYDQDAPADEQQHPHAHPQHHHKTSSLQRLDEVMRELAWFSEPDDGLDDPDQDHDYDQEPGSLSDDVADLLQLRPRHEVDAYWHAVRQYLYLHDDELDG